MKAMQGMLQNPEFVKMAEKVSEAFQKDPRMNSLLQGMTNPDFKRQMEDRFKELKEDPDKGVYVKDLTAVVVKDYAEIDQVLTLGNKHRTVGAVRPPTAVLPGQLASASPAGTH